MRKILYYSLFSLAAVLLPEFAAAQFTNEQKIDSTNAIDVEDQKIQILVTDFQTKRLMDADVMMKGLNPRKTLVFKDLADTTFNLRRYRQYTISVIKSGYMYYAHKFYPDEAAVHFEKVEMKPISVGLKTVIDDITFLGDETQIYHKSIPALEELLAFVNANPTVELAVIGHANGPEGADQKTDGFYRRVSEKRAEAVIDYLVQHGIDRKRLSARGMGNRAMAYPDPQTDWQLSANRRVEIEVTGF
jgi:outer membrane protein OmpA-like peptidoglycan-associated protein